MANFHLPPGTMVQISLQYFKMYLWAVFCLPCECMVQGQPQTWAEFKHRTWIIPLLIPIQNSFLSGGYGCPRTCLLISQARKIAAYQSINSLTLWSHYDLFLGQNHKSGNVLQTANYLQDYTPIKRLLTLQNSLVVLLILCTDFIIVKCGIVRLLRVNFIILEALLNLM